MNSRRPQSSHLFAPLGSTLSSVAAFSSKNGLPFLKHASSAGFVAGVFFGRGRWQCGNAAHAVSQIWLKCCINEEMQQFSWCQIH
jgi:hypothetical protein